MNEVKVKRASDIIGDGQINFYPELPTIDIQDIMGKDFMLMDAKILRDWPSEYTARGVSDWCLMQVQVDGTDYTTRCGGRVLVKRVAELQSRKALPITVEVVMQGNADKPYYNIR